MTLKEYGAYLGIRRTRTVLSLPADELISFPRV